MSEGEKRGGHVGPPGSGGGRKKDPYAQYTPENPQPPGRFVCVDCRGRFPEEELVSDQYARWHCMACTRKRLGQS